MFTVNTPGPVTVTLDIPAGRVRLIASDRGDTTVEVRPSQASKKRDQKAAEQTAVEFRDGVLRIATPEPNKVLGGSGSLDVMIALPTGSRLEGRAGAAELFGTGRLGEVAFEGGYRVIDLAEAAGARLQMHMGEVTIGRLSGPARITNSKGDITVAEAVAGAVELRTEMGNLSVTAAQGVSATLDAATGHGRITNALMNAAGAAAALRFKATTGSGDITAASL